MTTVNKPNELPDSKLIKSLIAKANVKIDYDFNYVYLLDELRKRVSIEVAYINLLFPEYTPHDEKYHLKRLFHVADQFLGNEIIDNLNVTEIFLLCASLYAHDWGMAVSEKEKKCIITGAKSEDPEINLLDDELVRFQEFCRSKKINPEKIKNDLWQEYIRVTHAFRSGKRVRVFFEKYSIAIGDYAARICEGHWLDFNIIDDYVSYPSQASINRDTVNVKALTIYLRLIDLLDLGEDRTPFVLWKFVTPKNYISKIEWEKHRALHAATFPKYQSGRNIQIDGTTDDHNVYMSIMDLKKYIDDQFRQSLDVLNRLNDLKYQLNIFHVDWRIHARGFEPVLIDFNFDRRRMFDILSDEIYKSNPYIFVRELLQNSFDAIQMRLELYQRKELSFKPKIKVKIEENDNMFIIQISDNGIGMDEYIVRNYLVVAGKSYYKSIDFAKEGLNMDPISRFGIGVLSCFMTADSMIIKTHKDPHSANKHEYLIINIPSKENYFRIEKNTETFEVGTTFKIFVRKEYLPKDKFKFNVTKFIKHTAPFTRFPIHVDEQGIEAVIVGPSFVDNEIQNVYTINYKYPLNEAFKPQHVESVEEFFYEKYFDLKHDLGLEAYEGCITYLLPKKTSYDLINVGRSWPMREAKLIDFNDENFETIKIKWDNKFSRYDGYYGENDKDICRPYSIFMDGILLSEITPPEITLEKGKDRNYSNAFDDSFVIPQLIANIPKPTGLKIDLARTNISTGERWDRSIWQAFLSHLKQNFEKELLGFEKDFRLLKLAQLNTFYKLPFKIIINDINGNNEFPIPFISRTLKLNFYDFKDEREFISIFKGYIGQEFASNIKHHYIFYSKYSGILQNWRGEDDIIIFSKPSSFNLSASLINLLGLVCYFINKKYYFYSIQFVSSPFGKKYPIIKEIWKLNDCEIEKININQKIDFNNISVLVLNQIYSLINKKFRQAPRPVKFPTPYEHNFAYSFNYLNISHPLTQNLLKLCLYLIDETFGNILPKDINGKLIDLINELPFFNYRENEYNLNEVNELLTQIFNVTREFNVMMVENINLEPQDFVENSLNIDTENSVLKEHEFDFYSKGKLTWGKLI